MINPNKFSNVGIISYGVYIPSFRIKTEDIAKEWNKDKSIIDSLGIKQKSVSDWDEDCLTMAVEASLDAISMARINSKQIGAVYMGSESFPYAVKPTSTSLANFLGIKDSYFSSDLEFACKAGTSAIQIVASLIESGIIDYGLAVGSDKSQSKPGGQLEYTASSGAAAFLLGRKSLKWLASLESISSYSSDTCDFWRKEGQKYPRHAGRFSGKPSYFKHIECSTNALLKSTKKNACDFDSFILHAPNKKFPQKAAQKLEFSKKQIKNSLLVEIIGNTYSANSLISLANVLDHSKSKEKILVTSYGSGAGSDSLFFTTRNYIEKTRKSNLTNCLKNVTYISYSNYLKKMNIL